MSSHYSKKERIIAAALSAFPGVKKRLKRSYQLFNYLLYKNKHNHLTAHKLLEFSDNHKESFFGYYDHSPLNRSKKYLLFHSTEAKSTKRPNPSIPVNIILFDFQQNKIIHRFQTKAWNWQQGSRLQWLDEKRFIYNDYDAANDRYISFIADAISLDKTVIDYPVYDCHNNFALGLNFDRLQLLRPDYGYAARREKISMNSLDDKTDGIFYIDLESNTSKLLISIKHLKTIKAADDFNNAVHKVNHIMISPQGKKFMFLHRWIKNGRRFDRLYMSDLKAEHLQLISENLVSHCAWKSENEIIGYFEGKDGKAAYQVVDLKKDSYSPLDAQLDVYGDGHPDIHNNLMVTDTYPDKSRMKELLVYDLQRKELHKAGEFYESLKFNGESRCDLHPSWDYSGEYIFFDSVHTGSRKLYALKYHHE